MSSGITDAKKVDYLWKKIGYAATKTDTNAIKKAPNEAIASPLLLRGDKTWNEANQIPATIPGSTSSHVRVYPTSAPDETTNDGTASANRTWKTGLTDWIPPEFGSTYGVKVYIHTTGDAGNAASGGTQVFAAGSGNNDEWFFDYQSGVLHFNGTNLPNGAIIHYFIPNYDKENDQVKLSIHSADGNLIKEFSNKSKENSLKVKNGGNSFVWNMKYPGAKRLDNMVLWGADFSGAKLVSVNLIGASLVNTNFTNVNLTDADLTSAEMRDVNIPVSYTHLTLPTNREV